MMFFVFSKTILKNISQKYESNRSLDFGFSFFLFQFFFICNTLLYSIGGLGNKGQTAQVEEIEVRDVRFS